MLRLPKNVDESIIEIERNELLYQAIAALPEIIKETFFSITNRISIIVR